MTGPLKFEAEMFDPKTGPADDGKLLCSFHWAARIAQAEYDKWMQGLPVVYGSKPTPHSTLWTTKPWEGDTHRARLFDIKPIKRDTAESLLRRLLRTPHTFIDAFGTDEYNRVCELLEDGE
jgi:hypothetical protein